ncbi:hypothetical protein [Sorangium sp. So ce176]|uniref:hypothetical protein n=1 Tax=Sorangium sp. So ce176 TaxID=3133286 RepID=UPI003F61BF3E
MSSVMVALLLDRRAAFIPTPRRCASTAPDLTRRPRALLPCDVVLVAFEADRQSAPSRPEELPWVDAYRTFATDRVRPVEMTARDGGRGTVPMAVAVSLTQDVAVRRLAERDHHIVRWTELARGGHFLATETPMALTVDLREFFGSLSWTGTPTGLKIS